MLTTFVIVILCIYLGVLITVFALQRQLIYGPIAIRADPSTVPRATSLTLHTPDGESLDAWFVPPQDGKPVIVYFHGNMGNLSNRASKIRHFTAGGLGLLGLSYRGYGGSSGKPSEKGLYTDARTAIAYLHSKGYRTDQLIFYGESLGTGIAVHMATEHTPRALVLEAPYISLAHLSQRSHPYIPAYWMVRDRYHSLKKIPHITSPLLIFHGEDDQVIPPTHGRALHDNAPTAKKLILFPGVGHTDFPLDALTQNLYEFVK